MCGLASGLSVSATTLVLQLVRPALYGRYGNHAGYAVSPDGRRLLILRPDARAIPRQINVVLNWFEELNAKVPSR